MSRVFVISIVVAFLAAHAGAGSVSPVAVTSTSTIVGFNRLPAYIGDLSGVSGDQHGTTPDGAMWLSVHSPPTTAAVVTMDLGSAYRVNGFHLWNYNESGNFTNRGAKDVLVSTSLDGVTYGTAVPMVFRKASGVSTYAGEDYALPVSQARYVKFDIQNNQGGAMSDAVGLSEVRFGTETALAGDLIRPVGAVASSELGSPFRRKAPMTIDGSGLDAAGGHSTGTEDVVWNTNFATTGWITYDLGATMPISGMHLWNYNEAGNFINRGMKTADIKVSLDGTNYTTLGTFNFTKAPGTAGYTGEDYSFGGLTMARYVKFDNAINFGGSGADLLGLSEVRFATGSLIQGVTATASSNYLNGSDRRVASNLTDGSGMSGVGLERASSAVDGSNRTMWLSAGSNNTSATNIVGQTVTFDLGGNYELAATRVWNYNEAGGTFTDRGVKLMDIAVSLDGLNFTTLAGPSSGHFALAKASGAGTYVLADMLDLDNTWAHFVRFTVLDYYGSSPTSDYVGLSEVRFYAAAPEPATLTAGALALSGLGAYLRRRRR